MHSHQGGECLEWGGEAECTCPWVGVVLIFSLSPSLPPSVIPVLALSRLIGAYYDYGLINQNLLHTALVCAYFECACVRMCVCLWRVLSVMRVHVQCVCTECVECVCMSTQETVIVRPLGDTMIGACCQHRYFSTCAWVCYSLILVENNRLTLATCPYKYLSRLCKVFLNNVNSFRYTFGQHHIKQLP